MIHPSRKPEGLRKAQMGSEMLHCQQSPARVLSIALFITSIQ